MDRNKITYKLELGNLVRWLDAVRLGRFGVACHWAAALWFIVFANFKASIY